MHVQHRSPHPEHRDTRITVRVPSRQRHALEAIADREGNGVAAVTRRLLARAIEAEAAREVRDAQ